MQEVVAPVTVTFQTETVGETWDEALPLVLAHHKEVGARPCEDLEPDKERYLAMEREGYIKLFTARERPDGRLVGYQLFMVAPHPHYKGMTSALQDLIYMAPEHRGLRAVRFILWADQSLEYAGARMISRHSPERNRGYGDSLARLGYVPLEQVFTRII